MNRPADAVTYGTLGAGRGRDWLATPKPAHEPAEAAAGPVAVREPASIVEPGPPPAVLAEWPSWPSGRAGRGPRRPRRGGQRETGRLDGECHTPRVVAREIGRRDVSNVPNDGECGDTLDPAAPTRRRSGAWCVANGAYRSAARRRLQISGEVCGQNRQAPDSPLDWRRPGPRRPNRWPGRRRTSRWSWHARARLRLRPPHQRRRATGPPAAPHALDRHGGRCPA